jgi:hypothetical protein
MSTVSRLAGVQAEDPGTDVARAYTEQNIFTTYTTAIQLSYYERTMSTKINNDSKEAAAIASALRLLRRCPGDISPRQAKARLVIDTHSLHYPPVHLLRVPEYEKASCQGPLARQNPVLSQTCRVSQPGRKRQFYRRCIRPVRRMLLLQRPKSPNAVDISERLPPMRVRHDSLE